MKKSSINKSKSRRVLLGPLDSGLNYDLKLGLEKRGFKITTLNFVRTNFAFPSDIVLKINQTDFFRASWRVLINFFHSFSYDIFHFRFGQSLLPWNLDLPLWKFCGKKMVMNFDGNDIRLSHRFKKTKYNRIFSRNDPQTLTQRIKKTLRYTWIKWWVDKITVATPDLLEFAPTAELVFNIVPLSIKGRIKPSSKKTMTILHAPTNRGLKGTKYIIKAVERLRRENYPVELIVFENRPHQEIDTYYCQADIVIDQLLMGALSTVSLEGMMYGKPVICYVRDDLRHYYPADLPVVSANSDTIYAVLKEMLTQKNQLKTLGIKGKNYVKKYHYPPIVARHWQKIYEEL